MVGCALAWIIHDFLQKMAITTLCHCFGRSPIFDSVFLYDKQNRRVGSAHHLLCLACRA